MKWLITGGAGFIGTNAAEWLTRAGNSCVLTDNFHRQGSRLNHAWLKESLGLGVVGLDVRDRARVTALFAAHSDADVVLHLAGQVSLLASIEDPEYDFDTNAAGTFNVLEAARRFMPRAVLIYAGTNKVYGNLAGLRYVEGPTRYQLRDYPDGLTEAIPLDLHGGYSCSKGAADQYWRDYHRVYGLKTVVLRQSSIYGGHQWASEDQGWVAYFVRMGLLKLPFRISGTGKQVRDLLHVSDLCRCFEAVAALPETSAAWGEALNIGGGTERSLSLLELFDVLRARYGFEMAFEAGPVRTGDQKVFVANTCKARDLTGWTPLVDTGAGLGELVAWSRNVLAS